LYDYYLDELNRLSQKYFKQSYSALCNVFNDWCKEHKIIITNNNEKLRFYKVFISEQVENFDN
jgi:hypothetical protein